LRITPSPADLFLEDIDGLWDELLGEYIAEEDGGEV
jgi:hypothetical protein